MRSEKRSTKKIIKKRIELNMGIRDKLRASAKPINVNLMDRFYLRTGVQKRMPEPIIYTIKDYGKYIKPENVDFDAILYISSFNRYDKLLNILKQLDSQETRYSYKIIIMNDGSTDKRYKDFKNIFPENIYLNNKVNGGQKYYWRTTNEIFNELKKYKTHAVIQIDDDFILCEDFINIIMDKFFEIKKENNSYMGIRYHSGSFDNDEIITEEYFDLKKRFQSFDGGSLFDSEFLKLFAYELNKEKYQNIHMWATLNGYLRKFGVLVYTFRKSLAFHNGNEDSKMYPQYRDIRNIHTKNFIDDKSGNDI